MTPVGEPLTSGNKVRPKYTEHIPSHVCRYLTRVSLVPTPLCGFPSQYLLPSPGIHLGTLIGQHVALPPNTHVLDLLPCVGQALSRTHTAMARGAGDTCKRGELNSTLIQL